MSCQKSIGMNISILQLLPPNLGFNAGYITIVGIISFWIQTTWDTLISFRMKSIYQKISDVEENNKIDSNKIQIK